MSVGLGFQLQDEKSPGDRWHSRVNVVNTTEHLDGGFCVTHFLPQLKI